MLIRLTYILLILCFVFRNKINAQDVPLKNEEEFLLRIQMEFKSRPPADAERIQVIETRAEFEKRTGGSPLPYLFLYLTFKKLSEEEVRFTVSKGGKAYINRRAEVDKEIKLDIGFTDDIKDRTTEPEYVITLLSEKRKPVSRIVIYFSEKGDYLVNGVKRGRI